MRRLLEDGLRTRREIIAAVLSALLLVALQLSSSSAAAQEVPPRAQLRADQGPHYVGVPVRLQVIAEGFEETPEPEIELQDPPGGRLELVGISPSVSTSIQVINGRMTQSKEVRFVFEYRLFARSPGELALGPFEVTQNGRHAATGKILLEFGEIPVTDEQRLRLVLPEAPMIVGQRLPVRIEWWVPTELRGKLFNPRISVPLFDRRDAFRFKDLPEPNADIALTFHTDSGSIDLPATSRLESWQGREYLVRTVTREVTPLTTGEYDLVPSALVVDEAVRWRRSIFGERIPTHARKRRVEDEPRTLVVRDLPAVGRPESFTGTVGRGYRLEVTADRSVVRAGDPIRLTLTLHGDAAVETAVLPPLTADGGLSPQDFRVPEERPAGAFGDGAKRFEVTVRARHAGVEEIPPLAFSWYDPERQEYRTTRSQPIALSVRPAEVVSADDVVSAAPAGAEASRAETGSAAEAGSGPGPGIGAGYRGPLSLTGADLAITTDIDLLRRSGGSVLTSAFVQVIAYALGLVALILAVVSRRRATADPAELARAKTLREQRDAVAGADSIKQASNALRRMVAIAGTRPSAALDAFLAECDAYAYAPGGASRELDDSMRARALVLADQML